MFRLTTKLMGGWNLLTAEHTGLQLFMVDTTSAESMEESPFSSTRKTLSKPDSDRDLHSTQFASVCEASHKKAFCSSWEIIESSASAGKLTSLISSKPARSTAHLAPLMEFASSSTGLAIALPRSLGSGCNARLSSIRLTITHDRIRLHEGWVLTVIVVFLTCDLDQKVLGGLNRDGEAEAKPGSL